MVLLEFENFFCSAVNAEHNIQNTNGHPAVIKYLTIHKQLII